MSELKDLVLTESVPAKLVFSFEEFEKDLDEKLKESDLIVTVDNLQDMKKLAASFNNIAKKIKADFKVSKDIVLAPLDPIELKIKSMIDKALAANKKIADQNKKFEDEQKVIIFDLLNDSLISEWEKQGVHTEFCQVKDLSSLIKLGSITKVGKLTSAATQSIIAMASQDKALQDQTEKRLLMLENQSYKSGLKAPLTRAHIESFLFSDEEIYQQNLDGMIASEIQRQEVAEQAMRATIEKEQAVVEAVAVSVDEIGSGVDERPVWTAKDQSQYNETKAQEDLDPSNDRINEINNLTGRALMALGLTKDQAVKVMHKAYDGELHGLRMVY